MRGPLDAAEHLSVPQDLAKVDVEHVSRPLHHDVVVMAITDAQDVSGHAVPSTRTCEVVHRLFIWEREKTD